MSTPRNGLRTLAIRAACILIGLSSCVVRLSDPYNDLSPDGNVSGAALDCATITPLGNAAPTGPANYRIIGRTAPLVPYSATEEAGDATDPNNPTNDPKNGNVGVRFFYSGTKITARFSGTSDVYIRLGIDRKHAYDPTVPPTLPSTSTPTQESQSDYALSNPQFMYYTVSVDGVVVPSSPLATLDCSLAANVVNDVPVAQVIHVATQLDPSTTHEIEILRESEEEGGAHSFYGLFSDPAGTIPLAYQPATVRPRKMLIIGDSITCGFGIHGANAECSFSYQTEQNSIAYGALAAAQLDAEVVTVAKSGVGVYKNDDGSTSTDAFGNILVTVPPETFPAQTGRNMAYVFNCQDPTNDPCDCAPSKLNNDGTITYGADPTCNSAPLVAYDPAQDPTPDVIVVNLGTNDVLLALVDQMDFETAYFAFIRYVRSVYPNAQILCAVSPMLSDASTGGLRTLAVNAIHGAVANINNGTSPSPANEAAGTPDPLVYTIDFPDQGTIRGLGCAFHPSVATQQVMANQLATAIHEKTCW